MNKITSLKTSISFKCCPLSIAQSSCFCLKCSDQSIKILRRLLCASFLWKNFNCISSAVADSSELVQDSFWLRCEVFVFFSKGGVTKVKRHDVWDKCVTFSIVERSTNKVRKIDNRYEIEWVVHCWLHHLGRPLKWINWMKAKEVQREKKPDVTAGLAHSPATWTPELSAGGWELRRRAQDPGGWDLQSCTTDVRSLCGHPPQWGDGVKAVHANRLRKLIGSVCSVLEAQLDSGLRGFWGFRRMLYSWQVAPGSCCSTFSGNCVHQGAAWNLSHTLDLIIYYLSGGWTAEGMDMESPATHFYMITSKFICNIKCRTILFGW